MRIIIDAMGGDYAPKAIVEGSVRAVEELGVSITLVGKEAAIRKELQELDYRGDTIDIVHTEDMIGGEEDPVTAIKRKETSMRVALNLLKDGAGDAVVSAGNTGALIAGATLFLKRIKGVRRAALTPVMPTTNGGCFLLVDAGANSDCTPTYLKQFAIMGSIYMKSVIGVPTPRVKLVNIGAEENKGPELITKTNALLKELPIRYEGYIEGRDIPYGGADVVVCDGFTGNTILKLMEGMGLGLAGMVKKVFMKNAVSKTAALLVRKGIKEFKKSMDYTEYGGAPVLGVTRPVIKAHGSSNGKAFYHAIVQAKKVVEEHLVDAIAEHITEYGLETPEAEVDA